MSRLLLIMGKQSGVSDSVWLASGGVHSKLVKFDYFEFMVVYEVTWFK